jgi:peptidoglycan L-alanyl-D-glutamate endopeptidase CwlK
MQMSRNLNDLEQRTRDMCVEHVRLCDMDGIDLLITCTLRTTVEQDMLYAQGRTLPGEVVTNAKAGQSFHQYGVAYDCVPMRNGKCVWDPKDRMWERVGLLGEKAGLEWSGRWKGALREMAHFQSWKGNDINAFLRITKGGAA